MASHEQPLVSGARAGPDDDDGPPLLLSGVFGWLAAVFGLDVVTQLCERLIAGGVPSIHFYALNQSALTLEICKRLGLAG